MAQNISGLFNYDSPETLQTDYLNTLASRRLRGGGDLYSQLANAGGNIGGLLGYTLGGLAGYKPAGMQKAETMDQIMAESSKGANPLAQATKAYELFSSNGMGREAQVAMERVTELQKEQDALKQTAALANVDYTKSASLIQAAKDAFNAGNRAEGVSLMKEANTVAAQEKATAARNTVVERRVAGIAARDPNMPADFVPTVANEDEVFKEWSKSILAAREQKNNVSYQVVGDRKLMYVTDTAGKIVDKIDLGSAPAVASTTVTMPAMEKASDVALGNVIGTGVGERMQSIITGAEKAEKNLPKMYTALNIMKTKDINTGIGASFFNIVNKVRQQYLNDKAAGNVVQNNEYLDSLVGGDVFNAISDLGIGARGIDTPAEKDFLLEVVTGKRSLNKEALIDITEMRIKNTEDNVIKFNTALKNGDLKKWEQAQGRNFTPIPLRSSGAAPSVSNW